MAASPVQHACTNVYWEEVDQRARLIPQVPKALFRGIRLLSIWSLCDSCEESASALCPVRHGSGERGRTGEW